MDGAVAGTRCPSHGEITQEGAGLSNNKRTASPRNATPIRTPTKLTWAKTSTAARIAAGNLSDLIGAFFHRYLPALACAFVHDGDGLLGLLRNPPRGGALLIVTGADKKMASSDTIIVSNPRG